MLCPIGYAPSSSQKSQMCTLFLAIMSASSFRRKGNARSDTLKRSRSVPKPHQYFAIETWGMHTLPDGRLEERKNRTIPQAGRCTGFSPLRHASASSPVWAVTPGSERPPAIATALAATWHLWLLNCLSVWSVCHTERLSTGVSFHFSLLELGNQMPGGSGVDFSAEDIKEETDSFYLEEAYSSISIRH